MDLRQQLRTATAPSHERLERALHQLGPMLDRERYTWQLKRFHGFLAVWEPALTPWFPPAFLTPRYKLALVHQDLLALGLDAAEIAALPLCPESAALCADPDGALGSLYVMEGSTLGGQIITRRLRDAPWCPAQGLRYFDPYSSETGARWRETLACLAGAGTGSAPTIVAGARQTFDLLTSWLVPDLPPSAAEPYALTRKLAGHSPQ